MIVAGGASRTGLGFALVWTLGRPVRRVYVMIHDGRAALSECRACSRLCLEALEPDDGAVPGHPYRGRVKFG